MKTTNFVFKLASLILAVCATVCLVLANIEKISSCFLHLRDALRNRCMPCCCSEEEDDYEDWDF